MRDMSASKYLAALSASDILVLIFYVLAEWLTRGLHVFQPDSDISFLYNELTCRGVKYVSYVSRFLSAWLVVAFTLERYVGVYHSQLRASGSSFSLSQAKNWVSCILHTPLPSCSAGSVLFSHCLHDSSLITSAS